MVVSKRAQPFGESEENNTMKTTHKSIYVLCLISVLVMSLSIAGLGMAQVPKKISYQGYLQDSLTGEPVTSTVQMEFALYDVPTGGSPLWSEEQQVEVNAGRYSVHLGAVTPLILPEAKSYYLGVRIDGEVLVDDSGVEYREELTSGLYPLFSDTTEDTDLPVLLWRPPNVELILENTFYGVNAGVNNTTGRENTFIGHEAGLSNTEGSYNTFVGDDAGWANTRGKYNTFIGRNAGRANTTGIRNTFIGHEAGLSNKKGTYNTFVGVYAGLSNEGHGNVFLGSEAGQNETGSDKLYIHNSDSDTPLIYGEFNTSLVRIHGDFYVTGSAYKPGGGSWASSSDQRLKEIQGVYTSGLDALAHIQPVSYRYKPENPLHLPSERSYVGVVAQEVQQVIPEAVEQGENGYLMVNNDPIIWTMLNAIKELNTQNEALKAQNEMMKKEIDLLKKARFNKE
jgi:hypothetical protein